MDQRMQRARSLIGTRRDVRGSAIFNRQILGDVSATANVELEHNEGRSLIGLGETFRTPRTVAAQIHETVAPICSAKIR